MFEQYLQYDHKNLTLICLILPSTRKKKESSENQNGQFQAESYNNQNVYLNQYYNSQYDGHLSTYDWNYDYNYVDPSQNIEQVNVILFLHAFPCHAKSVSIKVP